VEVSQWLHRYTGFYLASAITLNSLIGAFTTNSMQATSKQVGLLCYKLRHFSDSIPSRIHKGCDYKWEDISDALKTVTGREASEMIKMAEAAIENDIHPATLLSRIEEVQAKFKAEKKCNLCKQSRLTCCC